MKRYAFAGLAVSLALAMLLVAGCSRPSSPSGPTALYGTASLTLRVGDSSSSTLSLQPQAFTGTFADVTGVHVVVSGDDINGDYQSSLASVDLTLGSDGVWSGTIPSLPVGPTLTFTASGTDSGGNMVFAGTATSVLHGSGDSVAVAMAPVSDGAQMLFPIVQSVTVPGDVVVSSSAQVRVDVTGSANETLTYAFAAQGGTFDAATGNLALPASGEGSINATFAAPDSPVTLTQSVRVTNSQGNSVVTDFPMQVISDQTGVHVGVGFAPVVTGILGQRTGSDVSWTATVSDDGPQSALQYSWVFVPDDSTSTASFSTANANPGVLSGYDQTLSGTISLTVTDGDNLSTTVTFALPAGQFPDNVVIFGQSGAGFVVGFAPVVTNITGQRTGSDVSWTLTASDDGPLSALHYAWSFVPDDPSSTASLSVANANPGVLSGYDPTLTGTVTFTVTDGDGLSTTEHFTLAAGQFPDAVVTSP